MNGRLSSGAATLLIPALRLAALLALALASAQAADAPATPEQAQFGGQCTEGLAEGQHVPTSCNISWKDKDGKIVLLQQRRGQGLVP